MSLPTVKYQGAILNSLKGVIIISRHQKLLIGDKGRVQHPLNIFEHAQM